MSRTIQNPAEATLSGPASSTEPQARDKQAFMHQITRSRSARERVLGDERHQQQAAAVQCNALGQMLLRYLLES